MPTFEVDKTDSATNRVIDDPARPLADGEVRFSIDHFAITANNITYAAVGEMLDYWGFFPTEQGWGRVPAMGWGTITESSNPEVPIGGRYYGWYPMSDTLATTVAVTSDGLRDDGPHRLNHAPVYRSFVRTDLDSLAPKADDEAELVDLEHRHALLRGLFITGFLAEAFFADAPGGAPYFGASRVIVLSASSKTAIGFAQQAAASGVEVIGLTSAGNVDFVEGLVAGDAPIYSQVITYDDLETLASGPAVSIDMAGNAAVLARLHAHLGDDLAYSMMVGMSHHDAPPAAIEGGPTPEMFFAPTEVTRRIEAWGSAGYRERVAEATQTFVAASRDWLQVEIATGIDGAQVTWAEVLHGAVAPNVGRIVRP